MIYLKNIAQDIKTCFQRIYQIKFDLQIAAIKWSINLINLNFRQDKNTEVSIKSQFTLVYFVNVCYRSYCEWFIYVHVSFLYILCILSYLWNQCNIRTSFFFKDYTNWIKLDINWIMNSSMIHQWFSDWKKRLGQSYEEMKRTVETHTMQTPCCSGFIFLHERNPRTTTSSPCGSAERRPLIWIQCLWSLHVSLFSFLLWREYRLLDCFILQVHGNTLGYVTFISPPGRQERCSWISKRNTTMPIFMTYFGSNVP